LPDRYDKIPAPRMFLSNSRNLLIIALTLAGFICGCTSRPEAGVAGPAPTPAEASEFPFSVVEPEVFQAGIVVSGDGIERKMFVARDHAKYRTDYDVDSADRRAVIRGETTFLVSYKDRIYMETSGDGQLEGFDERDAGILLGQQIHANFERAGTENGLEKYEGTLEGQEGSRIVVWFDPVAKMVVKTEFYDPGGPPLYSTELRDLKLEASPDLFEPPAGFRRVTAEEFARRVGR